MNQSIFINRRMVMLFSSLLMLAGCGEKQISAVSSCSIDSVNNSGNLIVPVNLNSVVQVAGWALDGWSKQAPDSISINLISSNGNVSKLAEGKATVARPDVSAVHNAPSITNAGFGFSAKIEPQVAGIYELQILQYFPGRILVCKSNKNIKIE